MDVPGQRRLHTGPEVAPAGRVCSGSSSWRSGRASPPPLPAAISRPGQGPCRRTQSAIACPPQRLIACSISLRQFRHAVGLADHAAETVITVTAHHRVLRIAARNDGARLPGRPPAAAVPFPGRPCRRARSGRGSPRRTAGRCFARLDIERGWPRRRRRPCLQRSPLGLSSSAASSRMGASSSMTSTRRVVGRSWRDGDRRVIISSQASAGPHRQAQAHEGRCQRRRNREGDAGKRGQVEIKRRAETGDGIHGGKPVVVSCDEETRRQARGRGRFPWS